MACRTSLPLDRALIARLDSQGLTALDPANPYLATNLFLAKQSEQSAELKGFLKIAGTPAALELRQHTFAPVSVQLYYPAERKYYVLEQNDITWIISGPFPISDEVYKSFPTTALTTALNAPLVEEIALPPTRVKEKAHAALSSIPKQSAAQNLPSAEKPLTTTVAGQRTIPFKSPAPLIPLRRHIEENPEDSDTAMGRMAPAKLTAPAHDEETLNNIIAQYAQHPAEISPKGDLVHHVTSAAETLVTLSRWYTREPQNADTIARINKVKTAQALSPGDTIVIPAYMVKNTSRLTDDALEEIMKIN